MQELTLRGAAYRVGDLDAYQQFHVARRVAPIIATLGITFAMLKGAQAFNLEDMAAGIGPATQVLAAMPQDDADYVLVACLAVCQRQDGKNWAQVTAPGTAKLMYADINMGVMLRLVMAVMRSNLGDFFEELGEPDPSPSS